MHIHHHSHITCCLSVPFYDIISANNVETEHENEIEIDEKAHPGAKSNSNPGGEGRRGREEKELNFSKTGQQYPSKNSGRFTTGKRNKLTYQSQGE